MGRRLRAPLAVRANDESQLAAGAGGAIPLSEIVTPRTSPGAFAAKCTKAFAEGRWTEFPTTSSPSRLEPSLPWLCLENTSIGVVEPPRIWFEKIPTFAQAGSLQISPEPHGESRSHDRHVAR